MSGKNNNQKGKLRPPPIYNSRIPLSSINILPQPRKTFLNIESLGDDVASKNLYNPLNVARFNAPHCKAYIGLINDLWGDSARFSIGNLFYVTENKEKIFYVLIDGECRFKSCLYLRDVGCESCREKFGPGGCYERHFGDLSVDVRISENLDPDEAVDRQASANIHQRVPPHEEANFYYRLLNHRRKKDPDYSIGRFAKRMGRTPETIKQAVKFCELPLEYQGYVKDKIIPWGIAIEIALLKDKGLSEKELDWWVTRAITEDYKVPAFRELVSNFLEVRDSGQGSLMDLFSQRQREELEKPHFRMVVERHTIMALWGFIHYEQRVRALFEAGKLGKEDSPFSLGSPIRVFKKVIEEEEKLLPCLRGHISNKVYKNSKEVIKRTKKALSRPEEMTSG